MGMNGPNVYDELKTREFNKVIDKYLTEGTLDAEEYEECTPRQKDIIQTIKRSFQRLTKR